MWGFIFVKGQWEWICLFLFDKDIDVFVYWWTQPNFTYCICYIYIDQKRGWNLIKSISVRSRTDTYKRQSENVYRSSYYFLLISTWAVSLACSLDLTIFSPLWWAYIYLVGRYFKYFMTIRNQMLNQIYVDFHFICFFNRLFFDDFSNTYGYDAAEELFIYFTYPNIN